MKPIENHKCLQNLLAATTILLMLGFTLTHSVFASDSGAIGGIGGTSFTNVCPTSKRMSGVQIRHLRNRDALITQIRARCTNYASNALWANNQHTYTAWSNSSLPTTPNTPSAVPRDANCGSNRWVGAIGGETRVHQSNPVLRKVSVLCYEGKPDDGRTGQPNIVSAGNTGTGTGSPPKCPGSGIAYGLAGKSEFFLNSLKLKCKQFSNNPGNITFPTVAPALISPGSHQSRSVRAGKTEFHLRPVSRGTHYRLQITNALIANQSWYNQVHSGNTLFSNGPTDRFAIINIPNNQVGKKEMWRAQGCNSNKQCGPWSSWKRFSVVSSSR